MPQPFKGKCHWNLDSLKQRPELAGHIGLIAGMWSFIESQMAYLLSVILQGDAQVGATLFSVVKAESGRMAMIRAIAEARLAPDDLATFDALKKKADGVGSLRDKMMHNLWAVPEGSTDSLVLVDARKSARFRAGLTSMITAPLSSKLNYDARALIDHTESLREYKLNDFLGAEQEMVKLSAEIAAFCEKLFPPSHSLPP